MRCRPDSRWFRREHLDRTHAFYEKYGGKTIIYARFVPIVRTFAPFVAGIGKMDYGRFISFNVFGGIGWVFSMTMLGYLLGGVPIVKQHLEKVILLIILISVAPIVVEGVKASRRPKTSAGATR
jgi:membrane-associated protein